MGTGHVFAGARDTTGSSYAHTCFHGDDQPSESRPAYVFATRPGSFVNWIGEDVIMVMVLVLVFLLVGYYLGQVLITLFRITYSIGCRSWSSAL